MYPAGNVLLCYHYLHSARDLRPEGLRPGRRRVLAGCAHVGVTVQHAAARLQQPPGGA
jgi:hypothetical protein